MNSRTRRLRCAGRRSQTISSGPDVAEQSLQEVDDFQLADGAGIEPEVEIAQRHPGRNRKFLPVEVEFEHWCFAAGRPVAATMRLLTQSAFVRRSCGFVFGLFFNGWPALALPVADGFFVALTGFADGPLRAPVECPQDLPDVAFVIAHAELVGDQTCHPQTGPQRVSRSHVLRGLGATLFPGVRAAWGPAAACGRRARPCGVTTHQ